MALSKECTQTPCSDAHVSLYCQTREPLCSPTIFGFSPIGKFPFDALSLLSQSDLSHEFTEEGTEELAGPKEPLDENPASQGILLDMEGSIF